MHSRLEHIPNRRAIIDRRALADSLNAIAEATGDSTARRQQCVALIRQALKDSRAELKRRIAEHPSRGAEYAASYAFLTDQILRLVYDFATQALYPVTNPSTSERLTLVAVGGYGRGE